MNRLESFLNWLRTSGWLRREFLLAGAALYILLTLIGDIRNTEKYYGVDLRNRIVGARLLKAGVDPFSYFWTPGEPEAYLDGMAIVHPLRPANRITVTPPMLMFYWPISDLEWPTLRRSYLAQQWLHALIGGGLLLAATPRPRRGLVFGVLVVVFLAGDAFRRHVEVGQCYSVYSALWAAALLLAVTPGRVWRQLGIGACLGAAGVLRPSLILAIVPAAVSLRGWVLLGAALGAGGVAALCWPWADGKIWASYFRLQNEITTHRLLGIVPEHWRYLPEMPATVEGVGNQGVARDFGHGSARLAIYVTQLLPADYRLPALKAAMLALVGGFAWRWRRVARGATMPQTLLAGMALAIAAEFLIPAHRNAYNNIIWATPTVIVLCSPSLARFMRGLPGLVLLFALLLANGVLPIGGNDLLRASDYLLAGAMLYLSLKLPRWDTAAGVEEPAAAEPRTAFPDVAARTAIQRAHVS